MGADQDCDSCEYPTTAGHDKPWDDDDPHYSNQMQTGTCVRHALAKALALDRLTSKYIDVKPKDLINLLLTARRDKGASGAHPMDWNGKVLEIASLKDGHIYDCTIEVHSGP